MLLCGRGKVTYTPLLPPGAPFPLFHLSVVACGALPLVCNNNMVSGSPFKTSGREKRKGERER